MLASGDLNNLLGLGSYRAGAGGAFDYTTISGASGTFAAAAETLEFSFGGGPGISVAVTPGAGTIAAATTALNAAFSST